MATCGFRSSAEIHSAGATRWKSSLDFPDSRPTSPRQLSLGSDEVGRQRRARARTAVSSLSSSGGAGRTPERIRRSTCHANRNLGAPGMHRLGLLVPTQSSTTQLTKSETLFTNPFRPRTLRSMMKERCKGIRCSASHSTLFIIERECEVT